jgi:outer membrane protein assembly factor BamE (lipoprotein component of BamABCDE complex)
LDDWWFKYGGDPEGSISFNVSIPGDVLGKSVKIVNDKLYSIYSNSMYKNDIRSGSLRVGMSKDEILLFLGRPFSNLTVPGYDDVWVYGSGTNSFKILFKGTKSVRIL